MTPNLAQRAAIRRGADPSRVLGAGAGAGLAAGGIGYAAELGAITLNPALIIPGLVLLIGELTGLIPSFAGKPKLLDTVQAVKRLAQSQNPAIQQLAANIAIYAKNGVPISTSNPQQQSQLRSWIGGAINTVLQQAGLPPSSQNVSLLDRSIRNVLTSEVANSGARIDATIAQLGQGGQAVVPQAIPLGLRRGGLPRLQSALYTVPGAPQTANLGLTFPGGSPLGVAGEQLGIATKLGSLATEGFQHFFPQQPTSQDRVARGQFQQPQEQPILSDQSGQEGPRAPILDQTSDCPGCTRTGRQLQQQEQRTLRDIQKEQEQLTEQELSQQSQELSELESLETQPAGQRNIPQELQRKQQVLQRIRTEQQQLGQPGQPAPRLPQGQPGQPAPQLQPDSQQSAQREIEHELQDQHEHQPVQFCVGCKSQEDAILFLNGEPSQCSVIPGSTKEVNYG